MAGWDEMPPQGRAQNGEPDAPTDVLPSASGVEPTLPLPASPWARPNPSWPAPDESTRVAGPQQPAAPGGWGAPGNWTQAAPSAATPQQPSWDQRYNAPAGQQPYDGRYDYDGHYNASAGQQPYHGPQAYGQPAPGQPAPGYGPLRAAPAGPPQYPGGYQPSGYYAATPPPARRRGRGIALVLALLLASVVAWGGAGWVTRAITAADRPVASPTQPQVVPSTPQEEPGGQQQGGSGQSPSGSGSTTTSNGVSAAESAGVVLIEAKTSTGLAAGTGMVLTADGQVLTNYHVVAGSEKLSVTIADSGDTYSATVVGFDQTRDVALIQLKDAGGLSTVTPDTQVPDVGTKIAAVGNAEGGGELVKAPGTVTATDEDLTVSSESPWGNTEDLSGLIRTNAGAVPGDSGGPMFDGDNEVIGMTTAGSTKQRTSYAVPIATALQVMQQIDTGQDAGTIRVGPAGYLGIKVDDDARSGSGKTVTAVVDGSPAAKAGMTAGSVLTRVGDTTIKADTNLATVIRALEPGQQVQIEWTTESGRHRASTVTLGSSPVA